MTARAQRRCVTACGVQRLAVWVVGVQFGCPATGYELLLPDVEEAERMARKYKVRPPPTPSWSLLVPALALVLIPQPLRTRLEARVSLRLRGRVLILQCARSLVPALSHRQPTLLLLIDAAELLLLPSELTALCCRLSGVVLSVPLPTMTMHGGGTSEAWSW